MLEVGLVVGAGGQEHDPGVVAVVGGDGAEGLAESPEEPGQAADLAVPEGLREHPGEDDPVLQRVARPRRGLGPVGQDVERPARTPADVGRVEVEVTVAQDLEVVAGAEEIRMPEDQFGGQDPGGQEPSRAKQVGQDSVEQGGPLDQPRLDRGGVGRGDQERDRVQLPGTVHALGVAVDIICDPVLPDQVPGLGPALLEFGRTDLLDLIGESLPVRPDLAVGGDHLVVGRRGPLVVESRPGVDRDGRIFEFGHDLPRFEPPTGRSARPGLDQDTASRPYDASGVSGASPGVAGLGRTQHQDPGASGVNGRSPLQENDKLLARASREPRDVGVAIDRTTQPSWA